MSRARKSQRSAVINISPTYVSPCAIYWDIENVSVQSGQSADQFIKLIRDEVIHDKKLNEVEFVCVSGAGKLTPIIESQIRSSRVTIKYVDHQRNAADLKIIELIRQFVRKRSYGCNIVLISGDSDFVKTLIKCKIRYKVKIHLIHCKFHRNDFLDAIADVVYLVHNGKLRLVSKSSDVAVIKVKPSSKVFYSSTIRDDLQSMFEHQGAIKESIYFDEYDKDNVCIWIGFPSKELAKEVARDKHNQPYHNHPLIVNYVQYPPAAVIAKLIKHNNISVREETMKTLQILTPGSFSLSRSPSITSTISLPFKSSPLAYIIVTGFPPTFTDSERRHYLSKLLGKSVKSFHSTLDHQVWLHAYYVYQAKFFVDKINCSEYKLSATIYKQLPSQKTVTQSTPRQVTVTRPSPRSVVFTQPIPRTVTVTRPPPTPRHQNRYISPYSTVTLPSTKSTIHSEYYRKPVNEQWPEPSTCKWICLTGTTIIVFILIIIWLKV